MVTSSHVRFKPKERYSGVGDWQNVAGIWDKAQTRYSHADNWKFKPLSKEQQQPAIKKIQDGGAYARTLDLKHRTSVPSVARSSIYQTLTGGAHSHSSVLRSNSRSSGGTTSAECYRQYSSECYRRPSFGRTAVMSRLVTRTDPFNPFNKMMKINRKNVF